MNQQPQKSNAGIFAAVLGGLAAVGAVAAAATTGSKKTKLGRAPQRLPKKPCGCSGR